MLSRHFKTFQVKCNFCLEWMSLSTENKLSINICDHCLHSGSSENALKAVSSSGEIYVLHIIGQKSQTLIKSEKQVQTEPEEQSESEKTLYQPFANYEKATAQELDQSRYAFYQDIRAKWNIIQSFLNQKDLVSTEETRYLKILISQNPERLKRPSTKLSSNLQSFQPLQRLTSEFDYQQNQLKISSFKENYICESVSNFDDFQINIKIADRPKQRITLKKTSKFNQNTSKGKQNLCLKSPSTTGLKERDLNRNYGTFCKIPSLKQSNLTSAKRINTSAFDQCPSPISSRTSISTFIAQGASRSAFGSSCFNSNTKRLKSEQGKKFEQIKNKILKYLQKNYDSQPLCRLMLSIVFEAYQRTRVIGKSIELVSHNLSYTDFSCYLQTLDWTGIEGLKIVNTKLSDDNLKSLVDFIITNNLPIKVLVLTSNKLTETSIEHLASQELPSVKEIYLGKNHITKGKVRAQTFALQNKYSLYM